MIGKSGERRHNVWLSSNPAAEGASTPAHAKPARSGDPGLRHASIDCDDPLSPRGLSQPFCQNRRSMLGAEHKAHDRAEGGSAGNPDHKQTGD
jgi:hypothetical protein